MNNHSYFKIIPHLVRIPQSLVCRWYAQHINHVFYSILLVIGTFVFLPSKIVAQDFLRWSEEFNGDKLDTNNWEYQLGDGCPNLCGWGNDERQSYQKNNIVVSNGMLQILAKKESIGNSSYTSGRIRSINKVDFASGRIEVRARLPIGQAYWPAVWLLPTENYYGTWPLSGEIDLLEGKGQEPKNVYGTIHYGGYVPNNKNTGATYTLTNGDFTNEFHNFSLVWKQDTIQWFVDNILYSTKTRKDLPDFWWPYSRNFHFILNLAVGGYFLGYPNGSTPDNALFEVDYIRVYQNLDHIFISGPDVVLRADVEKEFYTQKITSATYDWKLPAGAKIVSGQGTSSIKVSWPLKSDSIKVNVGYQSKQKTMVRFVKALPDTCEGVIDNMENTRTIFWVGANGTYKSAVSNPVKDSVNNTALCNRYYRSGSVTYDALTVFSDLIRNAKTFEDGTLVIKMKLYTTAPIGTEVNINLENSELSKLNYPSGRRCVLQAKTTKTRAWEELIFKLILRPDANTPPGAINQLVLLFAPNSNNTDVFYFDEFVLEEVPCKSFNTGIQTHLVTQDKFRIFPNPFTNYIHVDAPYQIQEIGLLNSIGKELITAESIDKINEYIPQLEIGTYILRVTTNGHAFHFKIVKVNL